MLVAEIITRVREISGDTTSAQFSNTTLLSWINDAIRESALDNHLLQKSGTVPSVVGTESYPLPTDVMKLHSVKYDGVRIEIISLQEYEARYDDQGTLPSGTPTVAYIWAGNIVFNQKPDSVKNIKIEYIRNPTDITTPDNGATYVPMTPDLPVGYHGRIVDYCLAKVAEQDDDMNRYAIKMDEFKTGVKNLSENTEQEHDVYPSISVSDRDMGNNYDYGYNGW